MSRLNDLPLTFIVDDHTTDGSRYERAAGDYYDSAGKEESCAIAAFCFMGMAAIVSAAGYVRLALWLVE